MQFSRCNFFQLLAANAAALSAISHAAVAQDYQRRPIRLGHQEHVLEVRFLAVGVERGREDRRVAASA